MKFIRIIIAFFVIYVFLMVVALLVAMSMWMNLFFPDIPSQVVAKVTVTANETTPTVTLTNEKVPSAFTRMITRSETPKTDGEIEIATAQTGVLVLTYEKVTVNENFEPIGFRSMYRLETVRDASGTILYENHDEISDFLKNSNNACVLSLFCRSTETLTIIATPENSPYSITVDQDGLHALHSQ